MTCAVCRVSLLCIYFAETIDRLAPVEVTGRSNITEEPPWLFGEPRAVHGAVSNGLSQRS